MERLENKLNALRVEISTAIIALIVKHNADFVEVYDKFDHKPIIVDSFDDSMEPLTLNEIILDGDTFDVNCSPGYGSATILSNTIIPLDNLFNIYKWLIDNEDDLFE